MFFLSKRRGRTQPHAPFANIAYLKFAASCNVRIATPSAKLVVKADDREE